MPKPFFQHSAREQRDALGFAAERLGRPAAILEKDVMVVWTLGALYASEHGDSLSFKGGTSLSKVYGLIDRFSEDIDITYDIRRFLTDFDISGGRHTREQEPSNEVDQRSSREIAGVDL